MISCRHIEWTKIDRMKDLVYFLGAAELLIVEILMLISQLSPETSISVRSRRLFCTATCPLGAHVLLLSGKRRLSVSRRLNMCSF